MTETSERLCRDCKWVERLPDGKVRYAPACRHALSSVRAVDLVTGVPLGGGFMMAEEMRSNYPRPWRQTYCGLDGDLFEAREP